ncbi:MAG: FAD:protein FMN transferase [Actinomycetota bacterium]
MPAEARFRAMGSDVHVIVVGDHRLLDRARRRIDELERRWSRFIPDSEISVLNEQRGVPRCVSEDTFTLVRRAVDAWRASAGRFDPTVLGDMIRAGYDRPFEGFVVRKNGGISTLRRDCGGIVLDPVARTVTLPEHAGFDPGGIGKGLAADIVVSELISAGADGACVNVGGDLRVEGAGPDDDRWVIGIAHPLDGSPVTSVSLAAGAVATSATNRRAWIAGGERRHHLIDPASGRSAVGGAIAVTALAREAAWAEVATKAALLSPPGWEMDTLTELGCDGVGVSADGSIGVSRGFHRFEVVPA